jgi:hypothetical protein
MDQKGGIQLSTILELVERTREKEKNQAKIAKMKIPPEYHDFIIFLEQNMLLANRKPSQGEYPLAEGVFEYENKTYIKVNVPYFKVDGRIKMFTDAHLGQNGVRSKFTVESNIDKVQEILENTGDITPKYPLVVRIHSEIFGTLEGVSKINWDGKGADRTNPIENAYTSAIGRALALGGFGLLGTGIASAEEMEQALIRSERFKNEPVVRSNQIKPKTDEQIEQPPQQLQEKPPQQSDVNPRLEFFAKIQSWVVEKGYDFGSIREEIEKMTDNLKAEDYKKLITEPEFTSICNAAEFIALKKKESPFTPGPVATKVKIVDPGKLENYQGKAIRLAQTQDGRKIVLSPALKVEPGQELIVNGKQIFSKKSQVYIIWPQSVKTA